jgi:Ser/Thr protein kinase RdoA (MazF antagonist)
VPESLDLDHARRLVSEALPQFGIAAGAEVELVKHRENFVFRVDHQAKSFAMRIHRFGYRTQQEVRTEVAFHRALWSQGVPVSEIVPTAGGSPVCLVTDDEGRQHAIDLQSWIEDAAPLGTIEEAFDGTSSLTPEAFHMLGSMCAQFHQVTSRVGRVDGYERQAWCLEGLVGGDAVWGNPLGLAELIGEDRRVIERVIASLRLDLSASEHDDRHYGIVHADFTPENVLVKDGAFHIIDFDDFGEGWYMFDLATVLFFYIPHPRYVEYAQSLIAGYRSVRDLPEESLALLAPMLVARGLTYFGWAAGRPGDETAEFVTDHLRPFVISMAHGYLAQPSSSWADYLLAPRKP